ncbi:MAG: hypothetical protein HZB56_10050 [Deltaproteobacteria bacterium]|nr:hypothetical protein [Deltaproteobacteria bacterium]
MRRPLVALCLLAPALAAADSTVLGAELLGRLNPRGLAVEASVMRRLPVPDEESPLRRGRYLALGALADVNPAWAQLGPRLEWVPWAPVQLAAGYDLIAFYGANGSLLRLDSDRARYGAGELRALRSAERSGLAHRLFVEPALRARLGRLLLRSALELSAYRLAGRAGTYYESDHDLLVRERDLVLRLRTIAPVALWREGDVERLLLGPAHEYAAAARTGVSRHRLGAVLLLSPWPRRWGLDRPRLGAFGGILLADRNRRGQPFVLLSLAADLDWPD